VSPLPAADYPLVRQSVCRRNPRTEVPLVRSGNYLPGHNRDCLGIQRMHSGDSLRRNHYVAGSLVPVIHQAVVIRWNRVVVPAQTIIESKLLGYLERVGHEEPGLLVCVPAGHQRVEPRTRERQRPKASRETHARDRGGGVDITAYL